MHTEIIDPVVNLVSVLLEVPEDIYQQEKMKVFSLDEYKPVAKILETDICRGGSVQTTAAERSKKIKKPLPMRQHQQGQQDSRSYTTSNNHKVV